MYVLVLVHLAVVFEHLVIIMTVVFFNLLDCDAEAAWLCSKTNCLSLSTQIERSRL